MLTAPNLHLQFTKFDINFPLAEGAPLKLPYMFYSE